jgi:predicted nucleic acid-binding Zn ribbon protein
VGREGAETGRQRETAKAFVHSFEDARQAECPECGAELDDFLEIAALLRETTLVA